MKGMKKMETASAVAYFVTLMVKTMMVAAEEAKRCLLKKLEDPTKIMMIPTEATKKHFLEMAESLSEETDNEVKIEKIKILIDILKEKNMMGRGNFSVYYYEPKNGGLSGVISWKGWYLKAPAREVTISFTGDEATLEFYTGTGRYSTFLELPDAQCGMAVSREQEDQLANL